MIKHRVSELVKKKGLTYSQFGRAAGIGMETARRLIEDPEYQMEPPTLNKCCKYFGVQPGEIIWYEES